MQQMIPIPFVLRRGHSDNPAEGTCAMAAIAWLTEGRHTDAPECACPLITRFVIAANDAMDDTARQRFIPYLHRIAGSRSAAHEAARLRIMWLAAVRVFAPRALDAAGLRQHAARLRALPDGVTPNEARAAAWAAEAAAARAEARTAAAAEAAAWAAEEEAAAAAARAEARAAAWDDYFRVLEDVLNAGPQGEPWSADAIETGHNAYRAACAATLMR